MSMETRNIGLLSNEELAAVAGGMMNDGRGQLDPNAPGAYTPYGGPGMSKGQTAGELILFGVLAGFAFGL
jgi:hypothetical protein